MAPAYTPAELMVALRGARRSLRHGGDGRFSPDGLLHCRWPSQVTRGIEQVVRGQDLLPSVGSGAIPDEVNLLAEEGLVFNPYLAPWLARVAAARNKVDPQATTRRIFAEAVLRFGTNAVYDGRSAAFQPTPRAPAAPASSLTRGLVGDQLRRFSLVRGADPDPVGVTAWSQPWVPLWLEWEAVLDVSDRLESWALGPVDRPIRIVLGGLTGAVEVAGTQWQLEMQRWQREVNERLNDLRKRRLATEKQP